jgi:hypothetical protein
MVNRERPHVLVLPEDDANRQIATGFHLEMAIDRERQMRILPVAGGWKAVLNRFNSELVRGMKIYPTEYVVLLIDFDENEDRLAYAKSQIPDDLSDRVFVFGVLDEPETLDLEHRDFEKIGRAMALDCREKTDKIWGHAQLRHNKAELERISGLIQRIFF